ncbi:MAG: gliding motility-associated C-terminal domain-containing protein [Saprospiraceae bacterium]|nr:gliding motility-associated C-terminal domain-containing protein [Saprospiraceae bacterium]MDW8228956.1 gliding motility-associated C-terminal domain-containing protein [Saprospiraceae bacterium]
MKYTIVLNRGQTYSGEAASQAANLRPVGTRVTSDKPIAITIKDDLLEARPVYGNYCRDIMGDQLIPINKTGTQYIVQKGTLNGNEYSFVLATENATQVYRNGVLQGTINAGQQITISIGAGSHFIQTSKPAYLYQMTGIGCEVSGAILPALDCTGSRMVRFVRPSPEDFFLYLITRASNQQGFKINGAVISASSFQIVPGSNGDFVAARLPFSTSLVPDGVSSVVENSVGNFHMGVLNGGPKTGCRYGYFSDFGGVVFRRENVSFCRGRKVQVHGLNITDEGVYYSARTNKEGCDTLYEVVAQFLPLPVKRDSIWLCPGASVIIGGKEYTQPTIINDTLKGVREECDTLRATVLSFYPPAPSFLPADTVLCSGDVINFYSPYPNTVWNDIKTGERYTVNAPGRVVASFNDVNGCPNRISSEVRWCCSEKGFYIPNAFAPNSGGLSRDFCVYPTGECSQFLLRIFDRWGSLLFETTSPDRCWDGTFRGKPMPTGVYVWVMEVYSDATKRTEILKGDVTLIR